MVGILADGLKHPNGSGDFDGFLESTSSPEKSLLHPDRQGGRPMRISFMHRGPPFKAFFYCRLFLVSKRGFLTLENRLCVSVHTPISRNALASGFRNNSKKPDANAYRLI